MHSYTQTDRWWFSSLTHPPMLYRPFKHNIVKHTPCPVALCSSISLVRCFVFKWSKLILEKTCSIVWDLVRGDNSLYKTTSGVPVSPFINWLLLSKDRGHESETGSREQWRKDERRGRNGEEGRGERIKGNGRKEKEGKALLLSLSRLKSRISLTWEPNLSNPPPPPHFPYGCPHLTHKLIDHCYRTYCAGRDNTETHCTQMLDALRTSSHETRHRRIFIQEHADMHA